MGLTLQQSRRWSAIDSKWLSSEIPFTALLSLSTGQYYGLRTTTKNMKLPDHLAPAICLPVTYFLVSAVATWVKV